MKTTPIGKGETVVKVKEVVLFVLITILVVVSTGNLYVANRLRHYNYNLVMQLAKINGHIAGKLEKLKKECK